MYISSNKNFNPTESIELYNYREHFKILSKLYNNNSFPRILLLSGEKGSGKFTFIFHLINFFFTFDDKKESYDIKNYRINTENSFYKNTVSNINENLVYIGKDSHKNVSVENIREIKKKFNTTSLNNLPRFTILDDVDLLNSNSANALLKLIEEPSDKNYFILINNKRKKMIDTLKSRSIEFKIFLNSKDKYNIAELLSKKYSVNINNYKHYLNITSPGSFIRICDCLEKIKINNKLNLYSSAEILLDKFRKDKKEIYLESIKFLLDCVIADGIKRRKLNFIKMGFLKKIIVKRMYDYENFSLSKNSVLETLKSLS